MVAVPPPQDVLQDHVQQTQEWNYQFGGEYYESRSTNASSGHDFWQGGSEEWYRETSFEDGETKNLTSAEFWEDG